MDRDQAGAREAVGQASRLLVPLVVEADVAVTLEPTLAVPVGHPVADQPDLGRGGAVDRIQASLGFRVKVPVIDAWPSVCSLIALSASGPVNRPCTGSCSTSSAYTVNT